MKPKPLLPILLLSCISCTAQVSFTVKAGAGISFFRNDNKRNPSGSWGNMKEKSKTVPVVGLAANIKLSEKLSLQPEILYDEKGIKQDFRDPSRGFADNSAQMTWHCLNVPLLLKARAYNNFFIEFGPSVSFLLKAKYDHIKYFLYWVATDETKSYLKFYAGLNGGISYRYKKFDAEIRYFFGLTPVTNNEGDSDPEIIINDNNMSLPYGKHRAIQFTIGYEL